MTYSSKTKKELLAFWNLFTKLVYKNGESTEKTSQGEKWMAIARRNTLLSQLIEISERADLGAEEKWRAVYAKVAVL